MSVGIPLPELDVTKPAQNPPPDALAEFQRAAQLQTAAAQQQAIQANTEGQQQQNQAQALQLKDEQLRRQLAPQFVQKDENGKPVGFDTEGLYNAMLQGGADPMTINAMRMKQVEMQKALLGLSDAALDHQQKLNGVIVDGIESVRDANDKALTKANAGATPVPAAQGQAPNPLGNAVPGTGGMPSGMLPNIPQAQVPIGKAQPGSPESLGAQPDGQQPTATESALQDASKGPKPITPEAQAAYQQFLVRAARMGIPVGQFKPTLTDTSDLDQAEAGAGLHAELLKQQKAQADIAEAAGRGAQAQSEAEAALWKPAGEGTLMNVRTGQVVHGVASPDVEEFRAYIGRGGDPTQYSAWKAAQTAKATEGTDVNKAVATEVAKQNALAPELQSITNTTRAGHQYINREDIPPGSAGVTEQQALKAGIPVVNKDVASMLSDIDTAKANQDYMLQQIGSKLATDPSGRILSAPENTIEKLAQTDPAMAAVGTYRNAAIQSMRAVAGSRGLRINQYEVQMAIDNDIPKLTDTLPVAQQKLQNLKAFLDNTEQAHLVRNRQGAQPPTPTPNSAPAKFNVGDSVMYNGAPHKVTAVDPNTGKLTLAP